MDRRYGGLWRRSSLMLCCRFPPKPPCFESASSFLCLRAPSVHDRNISGTACFLLPAAFCFTKPAPRWELWLGTRQARPHLSPRGSALRQAQPCSPAVEVRRRHGRLKRTQRRVVGGERACVMRVCEAHRAGGGDCLPPVLILHVSAREHALYGPMRNGRSG